MSRDYRLYLDDMLAAARNVLEFTSDIEFSAFAEDKMRTHAVIHNLFVIGEAVRSIPEEIRDQYPEVEWRQINALRNLLAHAYFAVNLERLWTIVQTDIPPLITQIEAILSTLDEADNDGAEKD